MRPPDGHTSRGCQCSKSETRCSRRVRVAIWTSRPASRGPRSGPSTCGRWRRSSSTSSRRRPTFGASCARTASSSGSTAACWSTSTSRASRRRRNASAITGCAHIASVVGRARDPRGAGHRKRRTEAQLLWLAIGGVMGVALLVWLGAGGGPSTSQPIANGLPSGSGDAHHPEPDACDARAVAAHQGRADRRRSLRIVCRRA